jgi:hypothetical protein
MASDNIYNIDFNKLSKLLLPTFLRGGIMVAFVQACLTPFATINVCLRAFRTEKALQMSYNSQVCYLQKMLNDKFDNALRRIVISDADKREPTWVYKQEELRWTFLGTTMLNREDIISFPSEFVVRVPAQLEVFETEIRAWLNEYKLVTKFYTIIYIT